jgi:DNA-directed RNA polymerase specialized sigma24 family protein
MRELIERVCTPRQVDVLKLQAHGYGTRRIAAILGVSRQAIKSRLEIARKRVERELERREAA